MHAKRSTWFVVYGSFYQHFVALRSILSRFRVAENARGHPQPYGFRTEQRHFAPFMGLLYKLNHNVPGHPIIPTIFTDREGIGGPGM